VNPLVGEATLGVTVHADSGWVEVAIFPSAPTATHRCAVGHEIPAIAPGGATSRIACQALAPAPGLVDVSTSPALSPATHSDVDGHDIAVIARVAVIGGGSIAAGADHLSASAGGADIANAESTMPRADAVLRMAHI
jgi:hypothetical protein